MRTLAARDGQLAGGPDWPIFFAVDLHDGLDARVKLYVAHEHASVDTAARAGRAAGVDRTEIDAFCDLAGGRTGPYTGRPLISAYTFLPTRPDRPAGYSLYFPIRSYVDDDKQAWRRVRAITTRYRHDPTPVNAAIAAVTDRHLHDGVGLIAHVSLRLGHGEPGITVYLSSEAYQISPPRRPTHIPDATPTAAGGSA